MPLVYKDRVQETTTTTGTGTLTLAGAATGFQAFSVIGDGNTCVYTLTDANGSAWEVGIGTYTASGNTLARTTILSSSNSGSAINLSAGTHTVFLSPGAAELNKATLPIVTQAVTTANVTAAVNTHYVCTIAGLTANRNFVLPSPTAIGDRVRVTVTDGDADYELVLIGDTGITINGGSAATEWSVLFIAGESVEFVATASDGWSVAVDERKPPAGAYTNGASATQSVTSTTWFTLTGTSLNTQLFLVGLKWTSANGEFVARRPGKYLCIGAFNCPNATAFNAYCGVYKNSTSRTTIGPARDGRGANGTAVIELDAADTLEFQVVQSSGGSLSTNSAVGEGAYFSVMWMGD